MQRAITTFAAFLCIGFLTAQSTDVAPDDLLARGRDNYRAGRYVEAVNDLRAAVEAFLSTEQMQTYVNTGQFESLPKFETAVVYLAMSYAKLGREAEAREQIHRLALAEGIAPTYAKLPLGSDVADFEQVAQRIAPAMQLPANAALAALRTAPPPTQVAEVPPPPPPPAPTTLPTPAPAAPAPVGLQPAEQRAIEERVAAARLAAEQEAQQRIATERAAIERQTQERIADERAAAEKAAAERIAAERAAIEQRTLEQIAQIRAAAVQEVTRNTAAVLRRAEEMARAGDVEGANATYIRLMSAPGVSRDVLAAAATGLYQTGDYLGALRAFQRLGTFARGEEDLRFYKAVALFEIGRYAEAKKELACALPFIQMNSEIERYRIKIEQMR